MTTPHRIYIQPTLKDDGTHKVTKRGPLYDVTFNGEHICTTHQPLLDGARVLHGRGLTGPLEMWDHRLSHARMHSTVEKAAKLTVAEDRGTGIRFEKWKAHDDKFRGLNEERGKRAAGSSDTSNPETASDGLTAEAENEALASVTGGCTRNPQQEGVSDES
jgi:hypothetical protein